MSSLRSQRVARFARWGGRVDISCGVRLRELGFGTRPLCQGHFRKIVGYRITKKKMKSLKAHANKTENILN